MADLKFSKVKLTLDGKQVEMSLDQIRKKSEQTAAAMKGMKPDTKEWKEARKTLEALHAAEEDLIPTLQRVNHYMQEMAKTATTDLGKATRELTKLRDAMPGDHKDLEKVNGFIEKFKDWMKQNRNLGVTFDKAKEQLRDFVNTPTEKLQQGLAAINKEMAQTTDPTKRDEYKGYARQYEAELATRQYGKAGSLPMQTMNDEQLKAEQQRLRNLYMSTQGADGFEGISKDALDRLQKANQLIKDRADAEREAARAAKESELAEQRRLEFAQQGQQTHKTLANMEKASYEDLENALKHLEEQRKKYIQAGDTKHIQRNLQMQDKLKQKQVEMQRLMLSDEQIKDRVQNKEKYNVIQLQQAYDQLKYKLTTLRTDEVAAIKEVNKQMHTLDKTIKGVQGEVTGLQKIWQTAVRNIATYMGVFAIAGFAKNKIQSLVKDNLALSDSMAQVQKVTGLTSEEVKKLNVNLAKMDTRTGIEQLNELAFTAGKMGIGKYGLEGIQGFVKAANELQVALGDDLGSSVEESILPLAKLGENLGLFEKLGTEKAMKAIGSSINELSQTTTAAGKNIVDFARRIQPAAQMIGLTTDEILALGSASDSFGVSSEISATAFTKFLAAYRTNTVEIEKILNMLPGTLDKFFDEGKTMEGLLAIFQRMHEIGDLRYLKDAFDALGSEGSRMFTTFGAFSKNIDMFREHLATSTKAFDEATSVTREYNLVQETAQGIIERSNNIWKNAFVNPEGVDMVKQLADEWYRLSRELTESTTWMTAAKNSLGLILEAVKLLIEALPTLIRLMMFYGVGNVLQNLILNFNNIYRAVMLAGGGVARFNALLKTNAIAIAVTLLGYVVTKFIDMASAAETATDAVEENSAALERSQRATQTYTSTVSSNYATLMEKYDKLKREWKALKSEHEKNEWIRRNKQAFEELGLSVTGAASAEEIFEKNTARVVEGFKRRAEAAALAAKMTELYRQKMDVENEAQQMVNERGKEAGDKVYKQPAVMERDKNANTFNNGQFILGNDGYYYYTAQGAEQYNRELLKQIQSEYDNIDKQIDDAAKRMEDLGKTPMNNATTPTGDKGGKGNTGKNKELRDEFKDAKEAATGIISKLEEYYRLQEAAIQEARADGQLTEDQAKEMVRALSIVKNESLATARRAVTTGETKDWDELKTKVLPSVLADTSDVSQNLLSTIQQVAVDKLHNDLQKFNGSKDVLGLDSRAFFDQMNAKAAGNTREAARLRAAITNEVEKALKQYHFVELAQDKMRKDLETMGFMTETYEQWAKRMQEGIKEKPDTQLPNGGTISDKDAYNKMGQKFVVQRDIAYRINIENEQEALDWLQQFSKDAEGNMEDWTYAFPELQRWLDLIKARDESLRKDDIVGARQAEKAIEESMPAIQQFYGSMMQYEDAYYKALKQRDDFQSANLDSWWEHSDQKKENDRKLRDIQIYDFQYNTMHEGQGMGYMMGLTNDVSQDPEVLYEQEVLKQKIAIWEEGKKWREANKISEEEYQKRLQAMQDQTMAYTQKVMDNINKRISRIQAFVKPVETAANTIGKKLGDMIFNMESEESTWEQIWKNMALAMAESLLTMVGQYAQYQIQKSAINKSEVLDEAGKAQAITMLNISSGAAKTIGTLGWWGIALIPVITGLLMGLLTSALSTVNSSDSGKSTSAATKTKLVSGMLTYNKGNVERFAGRRLLYDDGTTQVYGRRRYIGQDGRVYTATAEPAPKDGLVTHPIATTVQGQPALVAERGPEIVIGRETTKAIMMNEPQLIKYLADYGKTGGFAGGYPAARGLAAYDGGNVETVNSQSSMVNGQSSMVNGQLSMVNGQLSPDDARALVAAIGAFNQTVADMQKKGIPCYINKYGRGGLIDEVKSGMKFMSKYEG